MMLLAEGREKASLRDSRFLRLSCLLFWVGAWVTYLLSAYDDRSLFLSWRLRALFLLLFGRLRIEVNPIWLNHRLVNFLYYSRLVRHLFSVIIRNCFWPILDFKRFLFWVTYNRDDVFSLLLSAQGLNLKSAWGQILVIWITIWRQDV